MLEPVTGTEKVYHVDLEGDLTKVAGIYYLAIF